MCKLKSGIILKDRIFMPNYDSHSDMLDELGIKDNYLGASKTFVRAELSPKDGDIFSNVDNWIFTVDQDITPEWFSEDEYRPRMIEAVKEWVKTHVYIDTSDIQLSTGIYYLKGCKNVTCNNSTVEAYGNSTVKAWDNSTVKAYGNSTVEAYGNSTVEAYGNSTVKAWDNSVIVKPNYSSFKSERLVLCDNSTFKDCVTKTIYQSGDWKLVAVKGANNEKR